MSKKKMEMHESVILDLPVGKVWASLNDPQILKLCVPGCEEIKVVDASTYTAKAKIKVGFISSKFNNIQVKKLQTIENQLLTFELAGEDANRIGSFVQRLEIKLATVDGSGGPSKTRVTINSNVDLKGKFATLGKRIVEYKAKKVTEEFLENLRKLAKEQK